jgi:hypothetical protein
MTRTILVALFSLFAVAAPAHAQYNAAAAQSAPVDAVTVTTRSKDGKVSTQTEYRPAAQDRFGNAQGSNHDLAVDGAFDGQTVAVLHFYTGEGFDFELPRQALKEKGFSVYRWINAPPSPAELKKSLAKADQLWLISTDHRLLSDEHVKVIKEFFDAGHGVYIWGDNLPYYADANAVAEALFGTKMLGDVPGDQVVGLQAKGHARGLKPNHLLTTGLAHLYEGITIATIQPNQALEPLLYGHEDNLVAAYYDKGGKRAILDGGFTRLYLKWDTAGTGRYVKNAAAWLANYERFGNQVVSAKWKK